MSEIPQESEKVVNPIKTFTLTKLKNIFDNKLFEQHIPLQEGFLFWKKNYFITKYDNAYLDIKTELEKKDYFIPRTDYTCDYYGYPECTYIKIEPCETGKTKIIFDNDC